MARLPGPLSGKGLPRWRLLALAVLLLAILAPAPFRRQSLTFWIWDGSWTRPEAEWQRLHLLGVTELYVKAGELRPLPARIAWQALPIPQVLGGLAGFNLHLVYAGSPSWKERWANEPEGMADSIARLFRKQRKTIEERGGRVGGLQVNLEVPETKLDYVRAVIGGLRRDLPGIRLSVAVLPAWLDSLSGWSVALSADEFVPLMFSSRLPRTARGRETIFTWDKFPAWTLVTALIPRP